MGYFIAVLKSHCLAFLGEYIQHVFRLLYLHQPVAPAAGLLDGVHFLLEVPNQTNLCRCLCLSLVASNVMGPIPERSTILWFALGLLKVEKILVREIVEDQWYVRLVEGITCRESQAGVTDVQLQGNMVCTPGSPIS